MKSCFSTFSNTGYLLTVWGPTALWVPKLWSPQCCEMSMTKWLLDDFPWCTPVLVSPIKNIRKNRFVCVCVCQGSDDGDRRLKRREKNRVAAQKSRKRQTQRADLLHEVCVCVYLSMLLHIHLFKYQLLTRVRRFLPFLTALNKCLRASCEPVCVKREFQLFMTALPYI